VEILRLAGVPVSSQSGAGFFAATEIMDMVALLKVLDNPLRDIELAAVLRSPLFGLTEDQLAAIRLHGRAGGRRIGYYECVLRYVQSGPDEALRTRLYAICRQLDQWRDLARQGRIAGLLWQVYRGTGYLSFATALPNGRQRRANLLKLHDRAIQFEGLTFGALGRSLGRFVEFLEDLLEQGQDWAPAEPDNSTEDAVRIQSIHKCKGLEFPVVFLVDLDRAFNRSDLRAECLFNEEDTLGIKAVHPGTRTKVRSAAFEVIRERQRLSTLAEEMRILYVAITRAREHLVLCGNAKADRCRAILRRCAVPTGRQAAVPDKAVPAWELLEANTHLDWLLWGLGDQGTLHQAFALTPVAGDDRLFHAEVIGSDRVRSITEQIQDLKRSRCTPRGLNQLDGTGTDLGVVRAIERSLAWQYPHAAATKIQAKQSVSDLSHRDDVFAQLDLGRALSQRPLAARTESPRAEPKVDPFEMGTAMHLVLQTLDLSDVTVEGIRRHARSLAQAGRIRQEILDLMGYQAMAGFFASEVGRLCLARDSLVYREWPFTIRMPASIGVDKGIAAAIAEDETVIVQGIVDLVIQTQEGTLVVDFKSDAIDARQVPDRAMLYQGQLRLYATAVESVLHCRVAGGWLYFLCPGQAFYSPLGGRFGEPWP